MLCPALAVALFTTQLPASGEPAATSKAALPPVHLLRTPDGGIQPQAHTDDAGTLHLLYFKGDPKAGDLYYTKRLANSTDFAKPIRVNSQPGSAVAIGNDRGGQLALGRNSRAHVVWNGSSSAQPKGPMNPALPSDSPYNGLPILYSRLDDTGDAFEPQRNLMTATTALDGGGSVAADADGSVYVVWHALPLDLDHPGTERDRRVFITRSSDDGRSFPPEAPASPPDLGACGCCGLKAHSIGRGEVQILFRSAPTPDERDAILLRSADHGSRFTPSNCDPWRVASCPMSTFTIAGRQTDRIVTAWESQGDIRFQVDAPRSTRLGTAPAQPQSPPPRTATRKYPALAMTTDHLLLAWTEGMAWGRGGTLHWQMYRIDGSLIPDGSGSAKDVPPWSLVAAVANPDGSFTVIY